MSLADEYFQRDKFVIMDKTTKPDGLGGVETVWKEGAEVQVALEQANSVESEMAKALAERQIYTVVTHQNVVFRQGDIIKRLGDGKCFRITSDADDLKTPASSSLDMRQCTAVEYVIGS